MIRRSATQGVTVKNAGGDQKGGVAGIRVEDVLGVLWTTDTVEGGRLCSILGERKGSGTEHIVT